MKERVEDHERWERGGKEGKRELAAGGKVAGFNYYMK